MIRLLFAGGISAFVSLIGTRLLIAFFKRKKLSQPIRENGPKSHARKVGTPSMGGIAIVVGACAGYSISHFVYRGIFTYTGLFVMFAIVFASAVGAVDDWLKKTKPECEGLSKKAKTLGLLAVGTSFSVITVLFTDVDTRLSFTRSGPIGIDLTKVGWVIWAILLILATANAVNLTDGLDGLAAGSSIFNFAAFALIGFWAFRNPGIYELPHALDLAVVAVAMLGGCAGFLWWNAAPAQIFMGDTGSLALGTALACLALTTNTHLLLPILCLLFVLETCSVMLQVGFFRLTGRRLFAMAPLHHHFEQRNWHETWVIVRLWLLAGFATVVALGLFYADFFQAAGGSFE